MSSIFVTRIPKGLKRESVSRIIKQGIETVAQVLKIWVHPDKGYAFVDLYCESSINIVLELSEQIEINGVPLKLEIAKPIIRGRKQQMNKLQGRKTCAQQQGVSVGTEFCGYRSYTEYQKHRYETESGNIPLDVPVRKRNKLKPWKKVKTQPTMISFQQRPTRKGSICFQHCKKRNCHQTISTDLSHTQDARVHVYNSSKYLLQIDVNNDNVFESIQTALYQNHICPAGSFMLSYNGKLLDKGSQATIYDNSNIHVTVKGLGGMNKDDLTESNTTEYGRAQTLRSEMAHRLSDGPEQFGENIPTSKQSSTACSNTETTCHPPDSRRHPETDTFSSSQFTSNISSADMPNSSRGSGTDISQSEKSTLVSPSTDRPNASSVEPQQHGTTVADNEQLRSADASETTDHPSNIRRHPETDTVLSEQSTPSADTPNRSRGSGTDISKSEKSTLVSPSTDKPSDSSVDPQRYGTTVADNEQLRSAQETTDHPSDSRRHPETDTFSSSQSTSNISSADRPNDSSVDPQQYGTTVAEIDQHPSADAFATNYDKELEDELRIVLIGKTGSGKSSTGNTILGKNAFHSYFGFKSITKSCQSGKANRHGKKLLVVDTPGMYDTAVTNELTKKEISRLVEMTIPGPHAIILVISIGRFTTEEQDVIKQLTDLFGKDMYRYMIVLLTGRDKISQNGPDNKKTLHEHIEETEPLKQLIDLCNGNVIAFDNTKANLEKEKDVTELISMILQIVKRNGDSHYTNDMYKKAVTNFRERALAIQEEHDAEIKRKEEKWKLERAKFDIKVKELEEENKRLTYQQKKRENLVISTQNELDRVRKELIDNMKRIEEKGEDNQQKYELLTYKLEQNQIKFSNYEAANRLQQSEERAMLRELIQMLKNDRERQQTENQNQLQQYIDAQRSMENVFESLQKQIEEVTKEKLHFEKLAENLKEREKANAKDLQKSEKKILESIQKKQEATENMIGKFRNEAEKKKSCTIL